MSWQAMDMMSSPMDRQMHKEIQSDESSKSRPDLFLWLLGSWPDLYASFCAAFTCQHNVWPLTHVVEVSSHTSHDLVSSFSQLLFRRFQQQNLYPRMFPRAPETSTTAFLSLLSSHTSKISSCPAPQPVVSLLTTYLSHLRFAALTISLSDAIRMCGCSVMVHLSHGRRRGVGLSQAVHVKLTAAESSATGSSATINCRNTR